MQVYHRQERRATSIAISSLFVIGPRLSHDKPSSFTRIHRVVIVLENEVLHEVVLRHALVAHRAVVAVGLTVALERRSTSGRGETGDGTQQRGHEHQPEEDETATQSSKEARARTVLRQPNVLRHLPFAGVAESVKVDDVGEVLTTQLEVDFGAVVFLLDFDGDQKHPVGIRDGAGATVLVAVNFARRALNVDVAQHDGHVVAVSGLARNAVGFGAGQRESEHRHEEDEREGAHGLRYLP